ncbi:MAG: phage portal protein [Bacillota bacterium]
MGIKNGLNWIKNKWSNVFLREPTEYIDRGIGYSYRPDRVQFSRGNEKSIINSIYNRIGMDTASMNIKHVQLDENQRYTNTITSGLNTCLTLNANIDQTGRAFMQDVVMSLFDEGCVAIVPVDTIRKSNSIEDIASLRTGSILEWYPKSVKVRLYNENTGMREDVIIDKSEVAIVENPLYSVMNEPNSTMSRLVRKFNLLDSTDEKNYSGKLDLIVQLPYAVKGELKRQQAEMRRKDIEEQLAGSKYGVAYTDGAEKIVQLNRAVENTLSPQVEFLTSMLYSQLGITQSILDGTADEKTMLNYYNRTIEPVLSAIVDEMKRKFLTKSQMEQGETIAFFRDPFKLVPVNELAEIADKFTRNEIMSSNEIRQVIGMKPSDDPKADELRNKNLSAPATDKQQEENQNG